MKRTTNLLGIVSLITFATACSDDQVEFSTPISESEFEELSASFDRDGMIGEPSIVGCTLSGGAETTCLAVTYGPSPASQKIGPFCPRNISDGPEKSGIWLEGGRIYDADGAFIEALPQFYNDQEFILYDEETGEVRVTDSKLSCEAAARPNVAEEYQNYCVECEVSYVDEGTTLTYVIPLVPVDADNIAGQVGLSGVGIAFSGARMDAPAPTDAILSAHTLAPFDDCGGHVNPAVGYHLHAATDCLLDTAVEGSHAAKVGLAMDGYPILARILNDGSEASGLDQCRGHSDDVIGYHYHANTPGSNAILPCHTGQTGCALDDPDAICDGTDQARRGPPPGERRGPPPNG